MFSSTPTPQSRPLMPADLNLVFICAMVDPDDPVQATTVRWIERLAAHPKVATLAVLALRSADAYRPPPGVRVRAFRGPTRLATLVRFYREVIRELARGATDFLIYQGGPYPVLLLPVRLAGRRIYQWKAHPEISPLMWFSARFCDTKVFTSTPSAFPLRLRNVRVIGQGVDLGVFRPAGAARTADFVTVGRVAPVKRLEWMIALVAAYNRQYGERRTLHIYGTTMEQDRAYRRALEAQCMEEGVSPFVEFRGALAQPALPAALGEYRLFLSFNQGALDRAVVEAMACAVPVLTPNVCVAEILPDHVARLVILPDGDLDGQIIRVHTLLSGGAEALAQLGRQLRAVVVAGHSLDGQIDRMIEDMVA